MSLPALKLGTVLLATAGEPSKAPFYVAGGLLVAWAAIVSFLGLSRADFPGTQARARGVMAISAILVLGATSMAVATSAKKKHGTAASVAGNATAPARTTASLSLSADPSGQLRYDKTSLSAAAGPVSIAFTNKSPSTHNVTIAQGARTLGATPTFTGASKTLTLTLKPGTYTFYCSVPGHRGAGMQGTLTVR